MGESKEKDIIEYSEDGSSYTSVDTPSKKVTLLRTYNKENTPHIYFKDEVGNIKEKAIELQYLDQTGPEIKGIASETWGSVVPISINIKDNKSGLKEYQISEKEEIPSTWKSISGNEVDVTEEVTSNGIYYIYAKDVLDNVSNTSVTVVKIDNIGPVVDFSVTTGNGTANIDASNSADNETGIAKYEYSVDNGTYYSSVTSSYNFTGLSHGSHIFNVRITDNAGNVNVLQKSASVSHVYTVTVYHMYYYHNSEWKETSSSSSKVIYNEKYTPTNITAPTGYYAGNDFEYLDANGKSLGTGTVGTNSVVVTQNIVINVHYYPNKYTVIYNANGGSGAPASQTKYYDTTLTLSSTVPTRSGYTFIGWGTSNSATSAAYGASSSYTGNANLTLYAIFRKTLTVTYKDGGGTQSNYVYVYNAQTSANITLLTERQYSDNCGGSDWNHIYDKLGWSTGTSPNGSVNYSNGQTISISSNLTLYGQYRKQIKIVYDGNGGTCSREYSSNIEYTYYNGSGNSSGGVPLYADLDLSCTRSGYSFNKKIYCNGDRTGLKMIGGTWNIGSGFNCGVICYAGWD